MADHKMKDFDGTYEGDRLTIGHNFPGGPREKERHEDAYLYMSVHLRDDEDRIFFSLPYLNAVALRDHLNDLLDDSAPVAEVPVLTDRAVEAMEELAHQLSIFDTDTIGDLADAIQGLKK